MGPLSTARTHSGAGEGLDERHPPAAAELVEGGGEGLGRVGGFELEAHVRCDACRFVAGPSGMAVAGPEPLTGNGETPRLRAPAAEGQHGGGARFKAAEDGAVGDDGVGGAYGKPTRAGDEAMRIAAEMGLELEPTYTAKAFAAALDQLGRGRRVAFIQTFAGSPGGD